MQDDELRAIQLADPLRLDRLRLTPLQFSVVKWAVGRSSPARSVDLATYLDVTTKTASGVLSDLYSREYLDRTEVPRECGGIEYEYHLRRPILAAYHEAQE